MVITLQQRSLVRDVRRRVASALLGFAFVLLPTLIATLPAQVQTFTVLYSFQGQLKGQLGDGSFPRTGLVQDGAGNLYGTTYNGGLGFNGGNGIVFVLDASGNERVLYHFGSHAGDGTNPYSTLIRDAAHDF
jgi:uncharacterized repeat protein (TIGR03803 family)